MTDHNCVVCFRNVKIYSVGECDHPVCYECSTRMRVLCRQNECPMCRHELGLVIFTERIRPFRRIKRDYALQNSEYHIAFENERIQEAFENLLLHVCKKCHNKSFHSFENLIDHMRRVHDLYSCDLCVDNLKIFPKEWRFYTKTDLNKHRKIGDSDNKSHRGHPLCEFCNVRYVDRDELYKHLRKDHLYCHICDAEGIQLFFGMYKTLRDHYRKDHYLCEEEDCIKEEFTSVFPSEIDLKAHKALVHCKNLRNKQAVRQARTLELEFTLAPRNANDRRTRPHPNEYSESGEEEPVQIIQRPELVQSRVDAWDETAFPSLTNNPSVYSVPRPKFIKESGNRLTFNEQNFPALGSETNIKLNITSIDSKPSTSSSSTISFRVNRNRSVVPAPTAVPFPSTSTATLSLTWVEKTKEKKPLENMSPPVESCSVKPPSLSRKNFPKLNSNNGEGPKKNKKSSVSIHIEEQPSQRNVNLEIANKNNVTKNDKEKNDKVDKNAFVKQKDRSAEQNENKTHCLLLNANRKKVKMKPESFVALNEPKEPIPSSSRAKNEASPQVRKKSSLEMVDVNLCDNKINDKIDKVKNTEKKKSKVDNYSPIKNKENKTEKEDVKKNEKEKKNVIVKESLENLLKESNKIVAKEAICKTSPEKKNQKKKSELKIGPLNDTKVEANNSLVDNETNKTLPPPGFETFVVPPPGLTPLNNDPSNQFMDNLMYFVSESMFVYQQPDDFVPRNSILIEKIGKSLVKNGEEALNDFKNTSILFRESYISASSYYSYCMNNIENDKFDDVFVDLVVLLPNILKQQELWTAHCLMKDGRESSKVQICPVCFQILTPSDSSSHISKHSLQNALLQSVSNGN